MTVGTIISRATGVLRLAVLAATLGVAETRFTDTYNLANTAPNILYELVLGGVIASVFVPIFVELLESKARDDATEAVSGIFNVSLPVLVVLAIVGVLAAPLIAGFYSSRLSGEDLAHQREVLTFLLRLLIPQVILYGIYFMASGVLNAHKRFVLPMWTPIVNNLVLIAVLVFFHQAYGLIDLESATTTHLLVLGLVTTASVAPMGLLLLAPMWRAGGYRLTFKVDPELRSRLVRLSVYLIGFVASNQLAYVIVQWLANGVQGGYTAYIAASTFFLLPVGLFVWSLTTVLLPSFSRYALAEDWGGFSTSLATGVRATLFLIIPSAAGFLVLGHPLVEAFLEHGVVTGASTRLIVEVLIFFTLGLVQFSVYQLFVRAFYALQDGRTPFLINLAVVFLNIGINLPMYAWFGVGGLAAGQAVAYTVGVVLQARVLRSRIGALPLRSIAGGAARVVVAAASMAGIVWMLRAVLEGRLGQGPVATATTLGVLSLVGAASYFGLAALLRVDEMRFVKNALIRRRP